MPKHPKTRPPLRIRTELSQEPWNAGPKKTARNQRERDLCNRIYELEQQIARLATGNKGPEIRFHVTPEVFAALKDLTKLGFWGTDMNSTAEQLMRQQLIKDTYL